MRRNPEQTQRTLTSASGAEDKGITVVAADDPATGLQRAREDIDASARGKGHSVLVLGALQVQRECSAEQVAVGRVQHGPQGEGARSGLCGLK